MTALLEARGLAVAGRLLPTDVTAAGGELVALIGPNGSGKTSLLRALAGVEAAGEVTIAGERLSAVAPARRPFLLGFLPASREMVWPIAARDVIRLGAATVSSRRIDALIERLELGELAQRPISSLSTGERARVLLARALAPEPRLLLLDEPLSNLDVRWSLATMALLRDEVAQGDQAALVAVHDLAQVEAFDRVLVLDRGKVVADLPAGAALDSPVVAAAFGVTRAGNGWRISPSAGRRSSP